MTHAEDNKHNPGGMSPLHLAAIDAKLTDVQQLLKADADPEALNIDRQPPLFSSLECGIDETPEIKAAREAIFRALWDKTPRNRLCQDKEGETVLHLMAAHDFDALIHDCLTEAPQLAGIPMYYHYKYPIHTAILNHHFNAAKALFESDPETANYKDGHQKSPLHYAVQYGSNDMVRLCCEYQKHNLDVQDCRGRTALSWAMQNNQDDIQRILIDAGATDPSILNSGNSIDSSKT